MSDVREIKIDRKQDWTSHSKVVIRTGNRELLHSLMRKTAEMSQSGYGRVIFNYGINGVELRIHARLGSSIDLLHHLLEGQDCQRLSAEAVIQAVN